jgi:undecaprenyl-diphosphatase
MTLIQAFFLGVIQGISEFLPISSSGHLVIVPRLFGWQDQGLSFDAFIHLGTLIAVLWHFRSQVISLWHGFFLRSPRHQPERRLAWLIIISTIPALIIGYLANDWIETKFRSTTLIAVNLIVWGIVLWIADWYGRRNAHRNLYSMTPGNAVGIGLAQALALIPGTSRSGITMTAGMFGGLDKKSAAEFSFLMSIPIITAAGGVKLLDLIRSGFNGTTETILAVGFLGAFVGGILAIRGLFRVLENWNFTPFVIYRVALGIILLLFL